MSEKTLTECIRYYRYYQGRSARTYYVDGGDLKDEIRALERNLKKAMLKINCLESRQNLCPDHRDKQRGRGCIACEKEALEARVEALEPVSVEDRLPTPNDCDENGMIELYFVEYVEIEDQHLKPGWFRHFLNEITDDWWDYVTHWRTPDNTPPA